MQRNIPCESRRASFEEVLVTAQLSLRPPRSVDLARENAILYSLAAHLSDNSQGLLQDLVEQACVLCDAGSCGVSLLETQADGATLFRWVAMGGAYKVYKGGTTPWDHSPCGETLRRNAPQLFSRPSRYYNSFAPPDPEEIEVLVVPLPGTDDQPSLGTIWIASHDEARKFDMEDVRLMTGIASFTAAALRMQSLLAAEQAARRIADAANAAKTAFITDISHEIRTPLNAIIGLADILSRSSPLSSRQESFIHTLRASGHQMMDLINRVLDIAKIEAGAMDLDAAPFSLSDLVRDVAAMVSVPAAEKGVEVTVNADETGDWRFVGDPLRIRQVITNLCGNAVKFTSQGHVTVGLRRLPSDDGATAPVEITVADTGVGIAPDKLSTIFDKFNQGSAGTALRYGGTGLGLAIASGLVARMNGTMSVSSTPGQGTVFTVILPLMAEANAASVDNSVRA